MHGLRLVKSGMGLLLPPDPYFVKVPKPHLYVRILCYLRGGQHGI